MRYSLTRACRATATGSGAGTGGAAAFVAACAALVFDFVDGIAVLPVALPEARRRTKEGAVLSGRLAYEPTPSPRCGTPGACSASGRSVRQVVAPVGPQHRRIVLQRRHRDPRSGQRRLRVRGV